MFTFLDHDGVPWNNNNAEHAIKRFAKYRRDADGRFTEQSLQEYLVLATVFETCELNNINVLKFLLSKETALEGLLKMAGRGPERHRSLSPSHELCSGFAAPSTDTIRDEPLDTQQAAGPATFSFSSDKANRSNPSRPISKTG